VANDGKKGNNNYKAPERHNNIQVLSIVLRFFTIIVIGKGKIS
jgi:hypothetical protein